MAKEGPSLEILKERCAKMYGSSITTVGHWVSEGAGQPAPSHVPTMENRGGPKNVRGRWEVSRRAWGSVTAGVCGKAASTRS